MTNRRGAVVSLLLFGGGLMLALLLSAGVVAPPSNGEGEPGTGQETSPPDEDGEPCSVALAIQEDLLARDFDMLEFSIHDTVWSQNPLDNVGGAFRGRIENKTELSRFLRSDAPEGRAARHRVLGEIPDGERSRALTGRGYVDVQFHVLMDYTGNSVWDGERVITPDGTKRAKSGDVVWVYVTRSCDVVWSASVRADCGNVGYHSLVPVRND